MPLLTAILRTCPGLHPSDPLPLRACDVSSRVRAGMHDCLYLALAERERCELVTADDRLVRNLRPHFPFIVPLSSLP